MYRRKNYRPFIICSLIIHSIFVLLLMKIWLQSRQPPDVEIGIRVDITHITRPEVTPREPPKKQPEPPPPEPVETVIKKPTPPKPTANASSDWLSIDAVESSQRGAIVAKLALASPNNVAGISPNPRTSSATRPKIEDAGVQTVALPQVASERVTLPPSENRAVAVTGGDKALNANSPDLGSTELQFWHRRGAALGGGPVGNSWGGGGGSGTAAGSNYLQMMTDLAMQLADAATAHEVDLVFVIDKTGSMEDNVRGIRAYIDIFLDQLRLVGHDTAVGLVTFADAREKKPKARGLTTDAGKFKNWLYKIDFEGGGDLAESGLDALMVALNDIKYRRGAQRFFVLASDGGFHDADYDGKSEYSQDEVIAALKQAGVRVDVIGLDYLPIKQLAWATGGTWRAIPGKGYLEYIPPMTYTAKMLSELGALNFNSDSLADELVVTLGRRTRPKWLKVSWKVLNPVGERCYGPFEERLNISNDGSEYFRFTPPIDANQFRSMAGTYTVIYRLENDLGHQSILRRAFEF